jgi:hypothetical protein
MGSRQGSLLLSSCSWSSLLSSLLSFSSWQHVVFVVVFVTVFVTVVVGPVTVVVTVVVGPVTVVVTVVVGPVTVVVTVVVGPVTVVVTVLVGPVTVVVGPVTVVVTVVVGPVTVVVVVTVVGGGTDVDSAKEWKPPAAMAVAAVPAGNEVDTGTLLFVLVPFPNWPTSLRPQASTCPVTANAKLWKTPPATEVTVVPAGNEGVSGMLLLVVVPSPN